jgi:hypothetical protein
MNGREREIAWDHVLLGFGLGVSFMLIIVYLKVVVIP